MSTATFADNPNYVKQEQLLIALHRLIAAGQCDSEAADVVRDDMELTWWHLSGEEQERLSGLSADLYSLVEDEVYQTVDDPRVAYTLFQRISAADRDRDWATVIELLRQRPISAPAHAVAGIRGHAYLELGHTAPAIEFLTYALKAEPGNRHYQYQLLHALSRAKRLSEAIELGRHFTVGQPDDLYWLIQYVAILCWSKLEGNPSVEEFTRVAVQLDELRATGSQHLSSTLLLKLHAALAVSRYESGDRVGAQRAYRSACDVDPGYGPDHDYLIRLAEDYAFAMPATGVVVRNGMHGSAAQGRPTEMLRASDSEWADNRAPELSAIFAAPVAA